MVMKYDDTLFNNHSMQDQYQNIVDSTNIVSKSDTKGLITYVNNKFIEISGYTREELIGKPHSIIRDPLVNSKVYKELWRTIKSKKIWHGTISNLKKDGNKYIVNASIFPILDENNEIVEYISIRHDITKQIELSREVEELHAYNVEQEHRAKEKLEYGIVNDMNDDECKVIQISSDILCGDFYSLYKRDDGSKFIYLIDGQGHGVSPALTVFAISSILNQLVNSIETIDILLEQLYPTAKTFLAEEEQLSYIMMMISADNKVLSYSAGGMYPFFVKIGDEIIKLKANNPPFMNFSNKPVNDKINIENWESMILHTDGIIENYCPCLEEHMPEKLINNQSIINEAMTQMQDCEYDDDATMIYLKNLDGGDVQNV